MAFMASQAMFAWEESVFWAVVVFVGTAMFLLVRMRAPLKDKFKSVSLFDLFMPALLALSVTVTNPHPSIEAALGTNSLRLVFLVVFFVGVGTGFRMIFGGGRHD